MSYHLVDTIAGVLWALREIVSSIISTSVL